MVNGVIDRSGRDENQEILTSSVGIVHLQERSGVLWILLTDDKHSVSEAYKQIDH